MGLFRRVKKSEERSGYPLPFDEWLSYFSYNGTGYPLGLQQTITGNMEQVEQSYGGFASGLLKANPVVFACMALRMRLFSEARFQFQRFNKGRPGDLFALPELAILETPWPGATTGDLLARAIMDVDLAGNSFWTRRGNVLRRLRPDWVTIVLDADSDEIDAQVLGYSYQPGGRGSGKEPERLQAEVVAHFAPIPDPLAHWRGMSWLTPVLREAMADTAATTHKGKFFDQGATPNLVVKLDVATVDEFKAWVKLYEEKNEGLANAYKTMFLGGGADPTVVGANFRQIDFKATQGAGETRIAAAAGVHPTIVGLSEGLQGSSLNAGNFGAARRLVADATMRPLWRNFAGSMQNIITTPGGSRLWYDDRDISFLREDARDAAEIEQVKAASIKVLVDTGFEPDSVVAAVNAGDMSLLSHTGLVSVQLQPPGTTLASPNGKAPMAMVP